MDTFGGSCPNTDYKMEAAEGCPDLQQGSVGNIDLRNLNEAGSR
jgi:hypothetical protein